MKRLRSTFAVLLGLLILPVPAGAQEQDLAALAAAVDGLDVAARVLVIAAHPDDEDTQLITWLARGGHVETAYMSLTRGDGGQNLIGNELGEALGVIRTEELLAARRVDGGLQFFARAFDFGYSKTAEETFRHWPRDSVLRDVVTVVRAFRPHVIVSVFTGTPLDRHGHHQVAGILAREAYDLAGDTVRMPREINVWGLPPWTPLKFYRGARFRPGEATLSINVGTFDPLYGRSYAEIAAISRSQHRSQGFGALQRRGVVMNHVRREHTRVPAPDDPHAEQSIFDGIEISLAARLRSAGANAFGPRPDELDAALAAVRATPLTERDALVTRLASVRRWVDGGSHAGYGGSAPASDERAAPAGVRELLDVLDDRSATALAIATGAALEAEVEQERVAAGERVPLRATVYNRGTRPLRVTPPAIFGCAPPAPMLPPGTPRPPLPLEPDSAVVLQPDSARSWTGVLCAPAEPTQPYWLAEPRDGSMFRVASVAAPEQRLNRGPTLRAAVAVVADDGGTTSPFPIEAPVVHRYLDPVMGDVRRPVAIVPAVSVLLDRVLEYAPAGIPLERELRVQLRSGAASDQQVRTRLQLPPGLRAEPAAHTIDLPAGATRQVGFRLTGSLRPGRDSVHVVAEAGGERFRQGYVAIEYEHIRPQRVYRPASLAIEAVDVAVPAGLRVGYVTGVADNAAPMLAQLGIEVTPLEPAALATADLDRFGAVVVGPRAYQAHAELVEHNARLLDYARRGGTLVVQYGQYEVMQPGITPFPLTIRRPHDRVTDEAAPVRLLEPEHPVLRAPNRITAADFDGWVQERGLYMPHEFDAAYTPLLETADPDEPPNRGGLLVASYGDGTYVYTSLAFFRQLPAGVPGAARLFVNLLAAGVTDGP